MIKKRIKGIKFKTDKADAKSGTFLPELAVLEVLNQPENALHYKTVLDDNLKRNLIAVFYSNFVLRGDINSILFIEMFSFDHNYLLS